MQNMRQELVQNAPYPSAYFLNSLYSFCSIDAQTLWEYMREIDPQLFTEPTFTFSAKGYFQAKKTGEHGIPVSLFSPANNRPEFYI